MNWKKKVVSFALALCMVLIVQPAFALDETDTIKSQETSYSADCVYVNGVRLADGEYWKNGDTAYLTGTASDYNAYFHDGTLYLNNAQITDSYYIDGDPSRWSFNGSIYADGDLNINVSGNNNINDPSDHSVGIWIDYGSLTIDGTGSLSIHRSAENNYEFGNNGITVEYGDLSILNCALNIDVVTAGIWCGGNIAVRNASVNVNGEYDSGISAVSMSIVDSRLIASANYHAIFCRDNDYGYRALTVTGDSLVSCCGYVDGAILADVRLDGLLAIAGESESSASAIGNFNEKNMEKIEYDNMTYEYVGFYSQTYSKNRFIDVNDWNWFYNAVGYMYSHNFMSGTNAIYFSPDTTLTRAMIAQILYTKAGKPEGYIKSSYSDVAQGQWYTPAIAWAEQTKKVSGYADGTFKPNTPVSREQLAAMLYADAGKVKVSGSLNFSDVSNVSDWAKDAMLWAVQKGIISGITQNGTMVLNPKGNATRAQAATMVMQYMK